MRLSCRGVLCLIASITKLTVSQCGTCKKIGLNPPSGAWQKRLTILSDVAQQSD